MSEVAKASWSPELLSLFDRIETADALDVLCVIARSPATIWSLSEIAKRVLVPESDVRSAVLHLRGRGLIVATNSESIRFAIDDAQLMTAAPALLNAYVQDREALLEVLAARLVEHRRSVATQRLTRMVRGPHDDEK